jgi:hypothetical protein
MQSEQTTTCLRAPSSASKMRIRDFSSKRRQRLSTRDMRPRNTERARLPERHPFRRKRLRLAQNSFNRASV